MRRPHGGTCARRSDLAGATVGCLDAGAARASRGWRKVAPEAADLLVSYEAGVSVWIQMASSDSEDERSRAMGSRSMALLDPGSRRRLWVGFIQAEVLPSLSREERRARIEAALERLFKEFPP